MKKLFLLLILLAGMSQAQTTVAPFTNPHIQLFNGSAPCSGCLLDTFSAGTTTPLVTYSDLGVTPNANPVVADSNGFVTVYMTSASYKFRLRTAGGVTLWTQDNVTWLTPLTSFTQGTVAGNFDITQPTAATSGANQSSFNNCIHGTYWTGSASGDDKWCLNNTIGTGSNPTSTLTLTHSGSSGTSTFSVPSAAVSFGGTLGNTNLGAANILGVSTIKQVSATTAFTIQDNAGVSHLFISGTSPYTNLFLSGNGSGAVMLGSAAKTTVDDVTGNITMSGSTSGTTIIKPSAVASGTIIIPAATDTLVGRNTTDTLTNKTITTLGLTGGTTNALLRFNSSAQVINSNTSDDGTNFSTGTVKLQVQSGVTQGSGFKHQRFGSLCTTAASAGTSCTTAVTWTQAFADANYTLSCTGVTQTNFPMLSVESIAAAGFTIRIGTSLASAATFSTVDCIAAHD